MNKTRVGIVGGGPGGLMTAYLLERRLKAPCDITIFEADSRVGGKIVTREFSRASIRYEAGAAELYDYSQLGPDPLRELIAELGLSVSPMAGETVVMDERILKSTSDIGRELGEGTCRALRDFNRFARGAISPAEYYESDWQTENHNPLSSQTFHELLAKIGDESARRYVEVRVHSDLATEPHLTKALYGLENYLMDEPDYMRLYSINGGLDLLPRALADRIKARVLLNHTVTRVEKVAQRLYRVHSRTHSEVWWEDFDFVVIALPNNWIPSIHWGDPLLADAMHRHHVFYDYPAHYLRVSVLFDNLFWRDHIAESYFMLDAFGGCCVYDESSRNPTGSYGVLSWLLAGEPALSMNNRDDASLIDAVLDSLPASLSHGRQHFVEGRVHRWVGTVDGLPGGFPAREPDSQHQPEPTQHPELFVVGDYLFDSTINGVRDSAEVVVEWIQELLEEIPAQAAAS
ncbi:MAG TPA: FAD-dependent oxidoreductase [Candidatus Acidoferrales bacterium]|nr:FAD-dependent oxidoreductase [Candidatus Acidoferrales bacterium]